MAASSSSTSVLQAPNDSKSTATLSRATTTTSSAASDNLLALPLTYEDGTSNHTLKELMESEGAQMVVIVVFPKASTPGCTKQVVAFNEAADEINAGNCCIVGASLDTPAAQAKFIKSQNLKYHVIAKASTLLKELNCLNESEKILRSVVALNDKGAVVFEEHKVQPLQCCAKFLEFLESNRKKPNSRKTKQPGTVNKSNKKRKADEPVAQKKSDEADTLTKPEEHGTANNTEPEENEAKKGKPENHVSKGKHEERVVKRKDEERAVKNKPEEQAVKTKSGERAAKAKVDERAAKSKTEERASGRKAEVEVGVEGAVEAKAVKSKAPASKKTVKIADNEKNANGKVKEQIGEGTRPKLKKTVTAKRR